MLPKEAVISNTVDPEPARWTPEAEVRLLHHLETRINSKVKDHLPRTTREGSMCAASSSRIGCPGPNATDEEDVVQCEARTP